MNTQPKEVIEYLVKVLVNNPDAVGVNQSTDEMGVLLEIKTDPTDMGMVIGRLGSTIQAIRTFARILGMKNKMRINVKIFDPNPRPYKKTQNYGSGSDYRTRGNVLDEIAY